MTWKWKNHTATGIHGVLAKIPPFHEYAYRPQITGCGYIKYVYYVHHLEMPIMSKRAGEIIICNKQ